MLTACDCHPPSLSSRLFETVRVRPLAAGRASASVIERSRPGLRCPGDHRIPLDVVASGVARTTAVRADRLPAGGQRGAGCSQPDSYVTKRGRSAQAAALAADRLGIVPGLPSPALPGPGGCCPARAGAGGMVARFWPTLGAVRAGPRDPARPAG